ncbi:stage III sporulation protein AB [Amphibacillus sp. MSJ-3]|uniref:stage III sporulation protein SpoIIIAB n=1 Tax=Amphibacillus sp. MSJ-3 TaxID=2841505 RepID=UPI001C0F0109|nr:stage III sporulation protein SpoIIIAB [Amphibacillus sp. MSJ-3]MBU5594793.1 stage III sporulation protein AB [Amphibacillus sp. MSJ-3]
MNWIGAILLMTATSLIGCEKASRLKKRPEQLLQLKATLQMMEAEIVYSQYSIADICLHIADQTQAPLKRFFHSVATELNQNDSLALLWAEQVDQLSYKSALEIDELNIMKQFGNTLGQFDLSQQQKQIQLTIVHLDRLLVEAQNNCTVFSKVYRGLGVLSGILIVLILI